MGGYDARGPGKAGVGGTSGMAGMPGMLATPGKQTLSAQLGTAPAASWAGAPMIAAPAGGARQVEGATTLTPDDDAYYARVSAVIEATLQRYQQLHVHPPSPDPAVDAEPLDVVVAAPYFNQRYVDYMHGKKPADGITRAPSQEYYDANKGDAAKSGANLMHRDAFPAENTAAAMAKGSPEQIEAELQYGVKNHLVTATAPGTDRAAWTAAWKSAIEQWMRRAGVGVDCAGLVYSALLDVQKAMGGDQPVPTTADLPGDDAVGNALTWLPPGDDSRTNMSTEMLGGAPFGPKQHMIGAPVEADDVRPGDVMWLPGHVRIVIRRDEADPGVVAFTTAESTYDPLSVRDAPPPANATPAPTATPDPSGAPPTNGPRMHHWKWDGATLWMRFDDAASNDWRDSKEKLHLRRHLIAPSESKDAKAAAGTTTGTTMGTT